MEESAQLSRVVASSSGRPPGPIWESSRSCPRGPAIVPGYVSALVRDLALLSSFCYSWEIALGRLHGRAHQGPEFPKAERVVDSLKSEHFVVFVFPGS
jgi:hypothetical protein